MVLNLRKNILILNDLSISCRLIRSDRRSLGLEIRKIPEGGAELLIRAPRRMKIAYIEWFINEKERWITEKYLAALVEKPVSANDGNSGICDGTMDSDRRG